MALEVGANSQKRSEMGLEVGADADRPKRSMSFKHTVSFVIPN